MSEKKEKKKKEKKPLPFEEGFDFELIGQSIPVRVKNPIDGKVTEYKLIEIDGRSRDLYLNGLGKRMRIGSNGKPAGVRNFDGLQSSLITKALVNAETNETVSEKEINSWPAAVVQTLFDAARRMNGLDDDETEDDAKND